MFFYGYLNTGRGVSAALLPVNLRFWVPNFICGKYPNPVRREYEAIAGAQPAGATADPSLIQKLVLQGTMVRPSLAMMMASFRALQVLDR